jgi:menaquinone-dependent protoporphyrinogen oxidase
MRVLVAYGTKRLGTRGIAFHIQDALESQGIVTDARPANERFDIDAYDAVIVGGALYANRWHKHARKFVKRYARKLRDKPVWFFSSGPLDDSAAREDIPPVRHVVDALAEVGGGEHITFGGRLAPDAKGFPASAMAQTQAGDWRDVEHIREWAGGIAAALRADAGTPRRRTAPSA